MYSVIESVLDRRWANVERLPLVVFFALVSCRLLPLAYGQSVESVSPSSARFRGPVDVAIVDEERFAATANELSSTVSLVDLTRNKVVDEIAVGKRPLAIVQATATSVIVSCHDSGTLQEIRFEGGELSIVDSIDIGFLPLGVSVDRARRRAYVGLQATGEVAVVGLQPLKLLKKVKVGRWPRYLALSPDGSRLAVGLSGDSSVAVFDTNSCELLYDEILSGGINLGHMQVAADGKSVYFPWMIYRSNPINVRNIRLGWVLASRIARVRLDGPAYREAISLDVGGEAMSDPHGIAITPNEHRLIASSSGTHELLVYRLADLPFVGAGGPGDLIDPKLLREQDLFYRIPVGGRPMALRALNDNHRIVVANHTLDTIQVVDVENREVVTSVSLGPVPSDHDSLLVHDGLVIFHDARRSLDQWYSCASCHLDGGSNAKAMDTWNDGSELTSKTVLPLVGVLETGPWTWHGWQEDLDASLQNSFVSTMQGTKASPRDLKALKAYLTSCQLPPNPFLNSGKRSEAALRGEAVFRRDDVGCAECHSGPRFSDAQIHDVGMNSESDKYEGYNTPSLLGVYRKVRLLHDGRAKSLESVLSQWHLASEIGGGAELTESELEDLIEYLKTL